LAGREIASHISYESDTEISIFLPTQKQWKYQHILSHFFPPFTYLYMVSWGKRETGTGCQTETKSVVSSGRGRKSRPALQGKRERFSRQRDGGEPGVRFRAQRPSSPPVSTAAHPCRAGVVLSPRPRGVGSSQSQRTGAGARVPLPLPLPLPPK
jgi:hypothetical protein